VLLALAGCASRMPSIPPPGFDWGASEFCRDVRAHGGRACDEHTLDVRPSLDAAGFAQHEIHSDPPGMPVFYRVGSVVRLLGRTPFTLYVPQQTAGSLAYCVETCADPRSDTFVAADMRNLEFVFANQPDGMWRGRVVILEGPREGLPAAGPSPAPSPTAGGASRDCTVDQVLEMRNSGLTDEQIRRACESR
jgi:hypothetical protein